MQAHEGGRDLFFVLEADELPGFLMLQQFAQ
jgi:hypothetical protein